MLDLSFRRSSSGRIWIFLAGPFCSVLTVPRSLWITRGRFSRFSIGAALSAMEKRLRKEG